MHAHTHCRSHKGSFLSRTTQPHAITYPRTRATTRAIMHPSTLAPTCPPTHPHIHASKHPLTHDPLSRVTWWPPIHTCICIHQEPMTHQLTTCTHTLTETRHTHSLIQYYTNDPTLYAPTHLVHLCKHACPQVWNHSKSHPYLYIHSP